MNLLMGFITKPIYRIGQEMKRETLVVVGPPIVGGTEHNKDFKTPQVFPSMSCDLHNCFEFTHGGMMHMYKLFPCDHASKM